ncbi:MAG TPA: DNA-processing protein DprA [Armatimonadota bacterium]
MDSGRLRQLLRLTRIPHLGAGGIRRLLDLSARHPEVLDTFLDWDEEAIVMALRCSPKLPQVLAMHRDRVERGTDLLLRAVQATGIRIVALGDAGYPQDLLGMAAPPPLLTCYGNLDLLDRRRAAVLSSRDPGPLALDAARRIAELLAEHSVVLVTGHNKPAYQVVAVAGKSQRGSCLMVLDRGLLSAFHGDLNREPLALSRLYSWDFDPEYQLALSPFRLDDPWIGSNSQYRDAIIAQLCEFAVVTHLRQGGIMEREVHRMLSQGKSVYVCLPDPEPPHLKQLLAMGAEPLPLDLEGGYLQGLFRDLFSTALPDQRDIPLET